MRIVQINATCGRGSTGVICADISKMLLENDIDNRVYYAVGSSGEKSAKKYAQDFDIKLAAAVSRISGNYGFTSKRITKRLVKELGDFKPDIVHLHNIHSHNCHLSELTDYLCDKKIKVVWTFHDCWAFTGYCTHFLMSGCDKWRSQCGSCPQYKHFSFLFDRSSQLFCKKRELLSRLDLTVVTPSQWLADIVNQSFLSDRRVEVIHNGVDLTVFKPEGSDFRKRYNIPGNKVMILGVSFDWSVRKGIDVFCELSKRLDKERYQIVLVGLQGDRFPGMPDNMIAVPRISDQSELRRLYAAADVFVNPTREDTFPTVNMEAVACGTPVITSGAGGCRETIGAQTGAVVLDSDVDGIINAINTVTGSNQYGREVCRSYACEHFDKRKAYQSYLSLYKGLIDQPATK